MIKKYVRKLAAKKGVKLTRVTIEDGALLGCNDAFILNMVKGDSAADALIFRTDIDELQKNGTLNLWLLDRLKSPFSRVQVW